MKLIRIEPIEFSFLSLVKELARKVIHVASCLVALWLVQNNYLILELLFMPVIAVGFYVSEKVEFLGKTLSFGQRRKWGGVLLAFGLSLVMFSTSDYGVKKFAILVLAVADVAASIIGKILPIRKVEVLGAYKSIGGSLAFGVGVMAALSLTWNIGNIAIWKILLSLVILEVAEFLNWRGIDNVTLPIASLGLGVLLF
jgi:dolichol kinase